MRTTVSSRLRRVENTAAIAKAGPGGFGPISTSTRTPASTLTTSRAAKIDLTRWRRALRIRNGSNTRFARARTIMMKTGTSSRVTGMSGTPRMAPRACRVTITPVSTGRNGRPTTSTSSMSAQDTRTGGTPGDSWGRSPTLSVYRWLRGLMTSRASA